MYSFTSTVTGRLSPFSLPVYGIYRNHSSRLFFLEEFISVTSFDRPFQAELESRSVLLQKLDLSKENVPPSVRLRKHPFSFPYNMQQIDTRNCFIAK